MTPGISFLDTYTIRARLVPALIAAAPALALIAAFISWKDFGLSQAIASIALLALLLLFADIARRKGKSIELNLFEKMGGKPSIQMLRHSDGTFDAVTKQRIHTFLGQKLKEKPPTASHEASDPASADAFYERGGTWLREHTRDTKKFHILFDENMTYGARRNLLGLKWYALTLNASVVLICVLLLAVHVPVPIEGSVPVRVAIVLILAALHAFYLLMFVNREGVFAAARQYARQLLLSVETAMGEQRSSGRSPKAKA